MGDVSFALCNIETEEIKTVVNYREEELIKVHKFLEINSIYAAEQLHYFRMSDLVYVGTHQGLHNMEGKKVVGGYGVGLIYPDLIGRRYKVDERSRLEIDLEGVTDAMIKKYVVEAKELLNKHNSSS